MAIIYIYPPTLSACEVPSTKRCELFEAKRSDSKTKRFKSEAIRKRNEARSEAIRKRSDPKAKTFRYRIQIRSDSAAKPLL